MCSGTYFDSLAIPAPPTVRFFSSIEEALTKLAAERQNESLIVQVMTTDKVVREMLYVPAKPATGATKPVEAQLIHPKK